MVPGDDGRCHRSQLPYASRHRELHRAGGAEQQHDEHSNKGFRRNGHGVYKSCRMVIAMVASACLERGEEDERALEPGSFFI